LSRYNRRPILPTNISVRDFRKVTFTTSKTDRDFVVFCGKRNALGCVRVVLAQYQNYDGSIRKILTLRKIRFVEYAGNKNKFQFAYGGSMVRFATWAAWAARGRGAQKGSCGSPKGGGPAGGNCQQHEQIAQHNHVCGRAH